MFVSQGMCNWKKCHIVSQGMRNWKKWTTVRDNKLMQLQASLQHTECVDAYAQYRTVKSGCFQSVAELQNRTCETNFRK